MQPNRHVIMFEATNVLTGKRYQDQLPLIINGSLAHAEAALEAARAIDYPPDAVTKELTVIGLHSWHEAVPTFYASPMAGLPGPDEDEDEITDIPRAWQR